MAAFLVVILGLLGQTQYALATPLLSSLDGRSQAESQQPLQRTQLGPRPYWLVDQIEPGLLKDKLASCSELDFKPTAFSVGHRGGGTLQIPEETKQSMLAGARMGAGIIECDVTFTSDLQLVCRHSQCDLHTTTNIVAIPELNAKCTQPFQPANPATGKAATANCCTSDITAAEFKTLCGKMDGFNASAVTPQDFVSSGTPAWRTDLYSGGGNCGTTMTHKEYIALVDSLGLQFTPELKTPVVAMPFAGNYTQEAFAQQLVQEYWDAKINFSRIWPQSFRYGDLLYWLNKEPDFAHQAMLLDQSGDAPLTVADAVANLTQYAAAGVKYMAPPLYYLVELNQTGQIVPSAYALKAKELGMGLFTWTLERSGWLGDGSHGGYYYTSIANVTNHDGDVFNMLHALAQDVGVLGVFTDWVATVTYYANCFNIFR